MIDLNPMLPNLLDPKTTCPLICSQETPFLVIKVSEYLLSYNIRHGTHTSIKIKLYQNPKSVWTPFLRRIKQEKVTMNETLISSIDRHLCKIFGDVNIIITFKSY